ncbi:hypothetical protein RRG08_056359 [Elysia crispata]|uniref:Uncharacterized protein n=1 Tax=Elysia crispata TaxID=231223 RepID=A0AAE1D2Y0_9GAST|nr:hypothetical protein RRG08_056359 [Elysia crispata]
MTPLLNDLDYLEELTNCLTNALARLVQLRPPDPITFIERSLRHHRRLHPASYQGREARSLNVSNEKTPIVSPDMPDGCHEPRSDITPQAGETFKPRGKQAIIDTAVDYGADFIVDDYSDSVDPSNIVHKHSKLDFRSIGDLFDDDDFG